MIEAPETNWLAGIVGALITLAGGLAVLRKQLSRDSTSIASDKAERSQISRLEGEIARLTTARERDATELQLERSQRALDQKRIAEWEVDYLHLAGERDRLMRDIKRAIDRLPQEAIDELETDFAALANVGERHVLK